MNSHSRLAIPVTQDAERSNHVLEPYIEDMVLRSSELRSCKTRMIWKKYLYKRIGGTEKTHGKEPAKPLEQRWKDWTEQSPTKSMPIREQFLLYSWSADLPTSNPPV